MGTKFLWSIAITFAAMFAAYVDGVTDYYVLTDQSISLFFSGFGSVIVGLVASRSKGNYTHIVEVDAHRLLISTFCILILFMAILKLGQFKDPHAPSFWLSGLRTLAGTLTLGIGLWLAEGFLLKERKINAAAPQEAG